jgi:hypothetical protein
MEEKVLMITASMKNERQNARDCGISPPSIRGKKAAIAMIEFDHFFDHPIFQSQRRCQDFRAYRPQI